MDLITVDPTLALALASAASWASSSTTALWKPSWEKRSKQSALMQIHSDIISAAKAALHPVRTNIMPHKHQRKKLTLSWFLFGGWESVRELEMMFSLWPTVCLRLCFVAEEKKKIEKKKVFSLSLSLSLSLSPWLCLVAEKWILWRENERKVQEKWFLNFLIFVFKVFNKLFIYLGHTRLNGWVIN